MAIRTLGCNSSEVCSLGKHSFFVRFHILRFAATKVTLCGCLAAAQRIQDLLYRVAVFIKLGRRSMSLKRQRGSTSWRFTRVGTHIHIHTRVLDDG